MPSIQLHDFEGKVVGDVKLPDLFDGPVSRDVIWQAVRMYLANKRQGTAETKTRGEVQGGGKKPWNQKHTGRARHGTIRSPIWRKGGIVFGPHPREHRYELPVGIRRSALLNSLRAKASENGILAVKTFEGIEPKTKALAGFLKKVKAPRGVLVVVDQSNSMLARISKNIPKVAVKPASDVNCYDVLASKQVVVTADGLKKLEGILK